MIWVGQTRWGDRPLLTPARDKPRRALRLVQGTATSNTNGQIVQLRSRRNNYLKVILQQPDR